MADLPSEPESTVEIPELVLETVFVPADANVRVVAESLLQEAAIPFYAKNENLQDLFGWGQIGGSNLLVGAVRLQVPAERAAEARELLAGLAAPDRSGEDEIPKPGPAEPEVSVEPVPADDIDAQALAMPYRELAELDETPPADPRVAAVRRLAVASGLSAVVFFGTYGAAVAVVLGMWALGKSREGIPSGWRFFALCGVLAGLIGFFLAVTAPAA